MRELNPAAPCPIIRSLGTFRKEITACSRAPYRISWENVTVPLGRPRPPPPVGVSVGAAFPPPSSLACALTGTSRPGGPHGAFSGPGLGHRRAPSWHGAPTQAGWWEAQDEGASLLAPCDPVSASPRGSKSWVQPAGPPARRGPLVLRVNVTVTTCAQVWPSSGPRKLPWEGLGRPHLPPPPPRSIRPSLATAHPQNPPSSCTVIRSVCPAT